jgi:hypothetical protein
VIAALVFGLCAVTSFACCVLLLRGWGSTGARLLLWSGIAFAGFALGNALLVVDTFVLPLVDLSVVRNVPTLIGIAALLWGLVWESAR